MPSQIVLNKIKTYVDFIREFVKTAPLQTSIDDIPYVVADGIGDQGGLYLDGKLVTTTYWKGQFEKANLPWPANGKIVLINGISSESGGNRYFGVIFHEFGHAALDKIGKNGSAVKEKNACAVELLALASFVASNPDVADAAKAFAKARKAASLYTFTADFDASAKAAYLSLTGESL